MKEIILEEYKNLVVSLRRHFHMYPELSLKEYKTCEYIEKKLVEYGVKNIKKIFNTGLSAVIGDEKKECIAVRCDMDALPIKEETGLSFKSVNEGVMHACAHDAHMAVLLAFAKVIKDNEDKLPVCVKLIFQPGEETEGGAKRMIDEGVLCNPAVKNVYGFHFWSGIDCGKVSYTKGVSFAQSSRFEIKIKGKGGHGAMPEKVINSLHPASWLINEFKKINEKYENAIVSLCSCNSDGTYNVFCENVIFKGTIRTLCDDDYNSIEKDIKELKRTVIEEYNCDIETDIIYEYPCLINDDKTLDCFIKASQKVLGEESVTDDKYTFAAEDFSYFTQSVPSAHIKIGISNSENKNTLLPLHNPCFDIDEKALVYTLEILSELIFR